MAKADRPPVQIDYSAGVQDFLHIEYVYNEHVQDGHEYTIHVKAPDGTPLYRIFSSDILDKNSLVILVAQHIAKDPKFGFGRDQLPYRWDGSVWVSAEKWMRALDFSMHAYAHTGHQKRDGGSMTAMTLAAWRANPACPVEGLDLRPFGKCKGIPFKDCVVRELGPSRQFIMTEHRPEDLNTRMLPVTFKASMDGLEAINNGAADSSLLMRFLRSSLDNEQLQLIQRWLGYHLITTVIPNAEKMLYMWGSGGDGKGQITWLIRALVGEESCAELQLADLAIDANLEQLVGALAMLGSEATTKTDLETLKQLVSREPMTCNPKYRDPFKFRPECLVTQSSNVAPSFDDKSNAMLRRVISLNLTRSFSDSDMKVEDFAFQITANEYSLLAGFALGGVFDIMETGRFTVPETILKSSAVTVASGNPYEEFSKRLEYGPYEIATAELYAVYKRWCLEENQSKPDSKRVFLANIEKQALKAQVEIKDNRSQNYSPSYWRDKGLHVPVAPDMQGKRPVVLQGVRVNDSGELIVGQDWPGGKRAIPLRAA